MSHIGLQKSSEFSNNLFINEGKKTKILIDMTA